MTVRNALFNLLMAAALFAVPLQYLIDPAVQNVLCAFIVALSAWSVLLYLRVTPVLDAQPLSGFALLGFCISSQLGALLVQTLAWTSLRSSLYDPLYTFTTLAGYQAIAVATHAVYCFFSNRNPTGLHVVRRVLGWAGIYRTPSAGALWFMGCVGTATFAFWSYEGAIAKIIAGFSFLAWAPFLIPFYAREIGAGYCNLKLNALFLLLYSCIAVLFGIAVNARGVMFVGVVTVALLYLLAGLRSRAPVTSTALRKLGMLAAALAVLSIPLSDLATAMVIARASRGKVSAQTMIRTTLHIWRQPGLLKAYRARQDTSSRYGPYDEHYIANPMLNRLVETKYYDNAFHFARMLRSDEARARLGDVSLQFVWVGLPQPVLSALDIKLDKEQFNYSMGDYLAYLARGLPLNGHKTGNMFAQGIVLFGPLFPFLYAAACLALFWVMDLLTIHPSAGRASICAIGMLEIWSFFMGGVTFESLHKLLTFFVRFLPQMLFFYLWVFGTARLFGAGRRLEAVHPPLVVPS